MEMYTCPTCRDIYELAMMLIEWASHNRIGYDFVCYFCGATMPNPHRPGCLHLLAQEYMEKYNDRTSTETDKIENYITARG